MEQEHILYWIWLSLAITPGTKASDVLLEYFGESAKRIHDAGKEEYDKLDLSNEVKERLMKKDSAQARGVLERCRRSGIRILAYDDPAFPQRLKRIGKRPVLLYLRGVDVDFNDGVFIATVGTRRMTSYGERVAYTLAHDLALAGAAVVSGLALGVDTVCHRGALDAGGLTVAVLGCGVDITYPKENFELACEMEKHAVILSEYSPGTKPSRYTFPQRNRIISGLCQGTVVVEGDRGSGALITANYAKSQGRDIFALPGMVGELNSEGPNSLLREGAIPVTNAAELLSDYALLYPDKIFIERIPVYRPEVLLTPVKNRRAAPARSFGEKKKNAASSGRGFIGEGGTDGAPEDENEAPGEEFRERETKKSLPDSIGENCKTVYGLLEASREPATADELTAQSEMSASHVMTALTILEIRGYVRSLPGGRFEIT